MANTDDLVVKIKADIRLLQQGLKQAAKEADLAGRSMERSLSPRMASIEKSLTNGARSAGRSLLGLGSAAVAAAGIGGLGLLIDRALDTADSLSKLRDKTGISASELQRLQYAAKQTGVDAEELAGSLSKFTAELGKAQGGARDAVAGFNSLGVALSDENGPRKSEAVLMDVLAVLERIPDPAARSAAAMEVFGKSGQAMAILASQGVGTIAELRAEAERLGLVLSDELVEGGDAAGDSLDRLKAVIASGLNKAILEIAPDINAFIKDLLADPEAIRERITQFVNAAKAIAEVGIAAGRAIGNVVEFASSLGAAVARMIHGSDVPFAKELDDAHDRLGVLEADLNNMDDAHPDLGFVKQQISEVTDEIVRLRNAQQDWYRVGAEAPKPVFDVPKPKEVEPFEWKAPPKPDKADKAFDPLEGLDDMIKGAGDVWKDRNDVDQVIEEQLASGKDAGTRQIEQRKAVIEELRSIEDRALEEESLRFDYGLRMLEDASEAELAVVGGYNAAKEELIRQHEDTVYNLRRAGLQSGYDMLAHIEDAKLRKYTDVAAKALQMGATYSKKLFEVNKVAGIANALVGTYQGAAQALKDVPYPLNIAAAAAVIAQGLAQVRAIQATKFGGGGASGSVAGAANPNNTTQPQAASVPQISLTLIGNNFSDDQVRALIDKINEARGDGAGFT